MVIDYRNVLVYPGAKAAFESFQSGYKEWWNQELLEPIHMKLLDAIGRYGFDTAFWSEEFAEKYHNKIGGGGSGDIARFKAKEYNSRTLKHVSLDKATIYGFVVDDEVFWKWVEEELNEPEHKYWTKGE